MSAIFGEKLIFGQQIGSEVTLLVIGDEFYARYETLQGYTVQYDLYERCYCYVSLDSDGRFLSTRIPITKAVPYGLRKHIQEKKHSRQAHFTAAYNTLRPKEPVGESSIMYALGPNNGLLSGRALHNGSIKGLTIMVEFDDKKSNITKDQVSAMLNNPRFEQHGNACSIRQYYETMSSGRLIFTNKIIGPITLSKKQSYYINNPLMEEALQIAIEQYQLDLSEFDSLNQGVVDALSFLYAGRTLYKNWLWPHNSLLEFSHQGIKTHYYTIQSLGRNSIDLSIGTFCHESGHMLCRFPDLYDYGQRDGNFEQSAGLGQYCLMSSGNHLNSGKTPSPVCVYLRDLAGWCDEVSLNQNGKFALTHGEYGKAHIYRTVKPYEYFMLENRSSLNLDTFLPDSGLAIFHCDTRGSNEHEDGTPERHYQCALIQADGHLDLEHNSNSGDDGDLYDHKNGLVLSDTTTPNSRMWDGTDSGLRVRNISKPDETITCFIGEEVHHNHETIVTKEDRIIPDNNPQGITSVATISKMGIVKTLSLDVEITHTYKGDLELHLISPQGTQVLVHRQSFESLQNLSISVDCDNHLELSKIKGEDIFGDWKLVVKDLLKDDVGRLNYWKLDIQFKPSNKVIQKRKSPRISIPDNRSDGVRSTIDIPQNGIVSDLEVSIDIEHTYRGDLQIELINPLNQSVLLKQSDSYPGTNLNTTYTTTTTPSLATFKGSQAQGTWTLKVGDLLAADQGILQSWELSLIVEEFKVVSKKV